MEDNFIKIHKGLYPLSFLYGAGVAFRNFLFDWGYLRSRKFNIPIICIGNLAVGGTGKTPHTEYLIRLLHHHHQVAVLSRGYKRRTKGYILAQAKSSAKEIGDEPYQIHSKFSNIRVAVDEDRCHGIEKLLKLTDPKVDVILLDDAFQHRYVKPGLNILLTDYHRLFSDDALLPAGRLRESATNKKRAQIIIVTKCPRDLKPIDYNIISKHLNPFPYQQLYFSTFRYGKLRRIFPSAESTKACERGLNSLQANERVLLLTGIASPETLVKEIKKQTTHIDLLAFKDHHSFKSKDMLQIRERFDNLGGPHKIIITTEKDATRLIAHPGLDEGLKPYIYALPIEVEMLQNQQKEFNQYIISYVTKNQRDRLLPKRKNDNMP